MECVPHIKGTHFSSYMLHYLSIGIGLVWVANYYSIFAYHHADGSGSAKSDAINVYILRWLGDEYKPLIHEARLLLHVDPDGV